MFLTLKTHTKNSVIGLCGIFFKRCILRHCLYFQISDYFLIAIYKLFPRCLTERMQEFIGKNVLQELQ